MNADDRPGGVFDAEDDDSAGTVIRDAAHPHGNINRACGATLKLDGAGFASSNEFAQSLFGHDDTHGYERTAAGTHGSTDRLARFIQTIGSMKHLSPDLADRG